MKAPWILVWALVAVPVFAQGQVPNSDRGAAFDVILAYVDPTTAAELNLSRDAVEAARETLVSLQDAVEPDEGAITEARENLASLRRELSDALRAEIGANEDLQAELRSVAQDARQDRADAVVAAATDEQALALDDNRVAIDVLTDELRSLRDDGATSDDFADQRDELRTLQRDQRELVREVVDANDDLRADLLADTREVRRDIQRDFLRDSRDRSRRDRLPEGVTPN